MLGQSVTTFKTFSIDDQKIFAELSGDRNPLHVDPLSARRSLVGSPVVHGINVLLWALDRWAARCEVKLSLKSLDVHFTRPIPVGAEVSLIVKNSSQNPTSIEIYVNFSSAVSIEFIWDEDSSEKGADISNNLPELLEPRDISSQQMSDMKGQIPLSLPEPNIGRLFPHLYSHLPKHQIAVIIATTRMVGCECPGLHSLYSELHLARDKMSTNRQLNYEVVHFDRRFNLVSIRVSAPEMSGTVKAFLRPAPQVQPICMEVRKEISAGEFSGQNALIIGGSRGLGEVIAKLLAMGGAQVLITYHRGVREAQRIVEDIIAAGGEVECMQLDVTALAQDEQVKTVLKRWSPTHLYFMATPFISAGRKGAFMPDLFLNYCSYYTEGFFKIFDSWKSPSLRGVFYPSTVFLDEMPPEMGEYVAAKLAGEALCAFLQKYNPSMKIFYPRLPRLATDQTLSLVPVKKQEPLPVMHELLRKFHEESKV